MKIEAWKCLSRVPVLNKAPWLEVESHRLKLPDGRIIEDWQWIKTPDFVNVVAVTPEGDFVCFRQQKYAVQGATLAIVGGYVDDREDPQVAAERELQEETGLASDQWTDLGSYAIDGNRGCGNGHLFLAENCRQVGGEVQDDLEDQEKLILSRAELEAALFKGEFGVIPWTAALALALLKMG
ncbi:NUDIX hydrolase [Kiritimatiellaeota bacterium B1221]|nr:NUDIX hydrolase [Kiritimatiellaeota bacterium B1221]